jgi:hypothetical protein
MSNECRERTWSNKVVTCNGRSKDSKRMEGKIEETELFYSEGPADFWMVPIQILISTALS